MDMAPLFELDAKEGEQNIKALPYVVDWFGRDMGALEVKYNLVERKLSAIYQFAKAMPLLFVPSSHIKDGGNKKRKRCEK